MQGNVVVIFGLWLATLMSAATASSRIYNMLDDNMHVAAAGNHIYNVLDYGAHGNGRDDDIQVRPIFIQKNVTCIFHNNNEGVIH